MLSAQRLFAAVVVATVLAVPLLPAAVLAQGRGVSSRLLTLPLLGSEEDERLRLEQLRGGAAGAGTLVRRGSELLWADAAQRGWTTGAGVALLLPQLRVVHNGALPHSLNEGSLWAGRGANSLLTAGVALRAGPVRVVLAPQLAYSENAAFQVIPTPQLGEAPRNRWATPFHPAPGASIDAPLRFGDAPIRRATLGQSALDVLLPGAVLSVATEQRWWGPATRSALVFSSQAEGFPALSLRSRSPLRSRAGTLHAEWMLGALSESAFFDDDPSNDRRAISAALLQFSPAMDSGLTVGLGRAVMSRWSPGAAFDVLRRVGALDTTATAAGGGREQITTLMARWIIPGAGVDVHAEWVRFAEPRSLADLLEQPGASQGYTLGLQWARPLRADLTLRVQGEVMNVEPDASLRVRPVDASYTSRRLPQGFTHRGRVLGAATGSGSSSQYAAADLFAAGWRVGVFGGRIRWDNAALWTEVVPQVKNEDITLLGGLRASASRWGVRAVVEYTQGVRLGYLYQDKIKDVEAGTHAGVDIVNRTVALTFSTALGR